MSSPELSAGPWLTDAPSGAATVALRGDADAIAVARVLASEFATGADERDRARRLPAAELERLSASGLLAVTVPARFGGAQVSVAALTEVFRLLATADASIAQIPHSHFVFLEAIALQGTEAQQQRFFGEALSGHRFANAQSERNSRTIVEDTTALTRRPDGCYDLTGEKFYATGALLAHWLAVRAIVPDAPVLPNGLPPKAVAYIRRDTPGITVLDDWDALGQRTTASGTVRLDHVTVPADQVVAYSPIFDGPTTYGARAQVLHAAIDAGVARAAVDAAAELVSRSRPWFESGAEQAADDPLLIQDAGEVEISVRAAEALLREAAAQVDQAAIELSAATTAAASIATAVAKVACARAAVQAASMLFELGGTRSVAGAANHSRLWRDARTHTLHDPNRWKVQHVGRWVLSGTQPPRHGVV